MLFSATLPREVEGLVKKYTKADAMRIDVRANQATVKSVQQYILPTSSFVDKNAKLLQLLGEIEENTPSLFCFLFFVLFFVFCFLFFVFCFLFFVFCFLFFVFCFLFFVFCFLFLLVSFNF